MNKFIIFLFFLSLLHVNKLMSTASVVPVFLFCEIGFWAKGLAHISHICGMFVTALLWKQRQEEYKPKANLGHIARSD